MEGLGWEERLILTPRAERCDAVELQRDSHRGISQTRAGEDRLWRKGRSRRSNGVVRWQACDLIMRLLKEFGISVSDDIIYRALKELGFSLVSACPKT
jgi:transposase